MCRKIRCDGESWKLFEFRGELNKASVNWARTIRESISAWWRDSNLNYAYLHY